MSAFRSHHRELHHMRALTSVSKLKSSNVLVHRFLWGNKNTTPSLFSLSLMQDFKAAFCTRPFMLGSALRQHGLSTIPSSFGGGTSFIVRASAILNKGWYLMTNGTFTESSDSVRAAAGVTTAGRRSTHDSNNLRVGLRRYRLQSSSRATMSWLLKMSILRAIAFGQEECIDIKCAMGGQSGVACCAGCGIQKRRNGNQHKQISTDCTDSHLTWNMVLL